MPKGGVDRVIQIMLAVFLGAILLPIAFDNWFATNVTQGWDSGVAALWPVIPIMALVGLLYLFYNRYT